MHQRGGSVRTVNVVTIVGAGTMGRGFAHLFASRGLTVHLADTSLDRARQGRDAVATSLATAVRAGCYLPDEVRPALDRIHPADDLPGAVAKADFVLEAVVEDMATKRAVWQAVGQAARPETVLATNTSSYDVNSFAGLVPEPGRMLGTHWYNPPQIVPCVEVIPAETTSTETIQWTCGFLARLGKDPAVCRSVPGFVGNRIQFAMISEAFRCLEEGVATAADIDRIVRGSFGFRLGLYGPFQIGDLNGLDTYLAVYDYLEAQYGADRFRAPGLLRELTAEGRLGLKTAGGVYDYTSDEARRISGERDARLWAALRSGPQEPVQARQDEEEGQVTD
jgi:3-hydroxybutyryl-CoA dehydrogenase